VAVRASFLLRSHGDVAPAAIALGVLAAVAAVGRGGRAPFDRPTLALGLLGVAALAGPGQPAGAGVLLLAGAVAAAAVARPAAAALGFPGAVALALVLTAVGGGAALALGACAGVVALGLAADAARVPRPERPQWWEVPAAAVGAWLLVAPGSWGWVATAGHTGLGSYDLGAGRALAAGLVAVEAFTLLSRRGPRWYARAS